MAKLTLTIGSCPVCGRHVARTVTTHYGLQMEHTSCPVHGRRERAPSDATVADWVASPAMPDLAEMLGEPAPVGVEWVC